MTADEHLNKRIDNLESGEVRIWTKLDELAQTLKRIELNTAGIPDLTRVHEGRIGSLEQCQSECRGGWKVLACVGAAAGVLGGAIASIAAPVIELIRDR